MGSLATTAILLVAVWDLLLLGRIAARWLGSEPATLASFLLATLLVVARRPRKRRAMVRSVGAFAVGALVGWTTYPAWVASISAIGLAIGLPLRGRDDLAGLPLIVATVLLAPLFEEILYRDRLLPALRDRAGAPLAILATSALFALPHLEAWSVLGTFVVGVALGTTRLVARSVAPCIGIHGGLNLAALTWGRG